ncbi:MAG: hypothetical protein KatS3mg110_3557 [Pirellulaceae bacterium]|nr:MAG: hypothetical protein KatS3mg110_3557 [Pirellulaceae bacterium]
MRCRFPGAIFACGWVTAVLSLPAAGQEFSIDDVLRAWHEREREAASFRFDCRKDEVVTGAYLVPPSPGRNNQPSGSSQPPDDQRFILEFTLAVSDELYYYHERGQVFAPQPPMAVRAPGAGGAVRDREVTVVYRDGVVRLLQQPSQQPLPEGVPNPPLGSDRHTQSPGLIIHGFSAGPLMLACRPISYYSANPTEFTGTWTKQLQVTFALGRPSSVSIPADLLCLVFDSGLPNSRNYVVVDPRKGFLPVRTVEEQSGQVTTDLQIDYEQHAGTWVPVRWQHTRRRPNSQGMRFSKVEVTSFKWNEPLPRELFELDHRPGAWVQEHRSADQSATYVVTPENRKRYLAPHQAAITAYEEAMRGEANRPWWVWIGMAVGVVVLLGAGVWAIRRLWYSTA